MKIYLASDHAGLRLKEYLTETLKESNSSFIDLGTSSQERVDYTDFAVLLCKHIVSDDTTRGILVCGSGIGMSIMANKIKGIRAAVCVNEYMAEMAVRHNNANVLCLGERVVGTELAKNIMVRFLNAAFDGGRHQLRVSKFEK